MDSAEVPELLAALEATVVPSGDRCKVRRLVDHFADQPGIERLQATFTVTEPGDPDYRRIVDLERLTRRLGLPISGKTIGEHRRRECRCYA